MRIAIVGIGNYSDIFFKLLRSISRYNVAGFIVDEEYRNNKKNHWGLPIICNTTSVDKLNDLSVESIFCPIGNNIGRSEILSFYRENGFNTPKYISPKAYVGEGCKIGTGVYIMPGAHIMGECKVRDFSIISQGVNIAHHTEIGEGVFCAMGSNIGGRLKIGSMSFVGMGATVVTKAKRIGKEVTVGAGAVVIDEVEDYRVVAGVPAKRIN
jgi:sugar O-acyltransferase (sialic acid O-acetyltransferase NeuD family)